MTSHQPTRKSRSGHREGDEEPQPSPPLESHHLDASGPNARVHRDRCHSASSWVTVSHGALVASGWSDESASSSKPTSAVSGCNQMPA
jgi:hypothetical protein